jgi:hypothetical protein
MSETKVGLVTVFWNHKAHGSIELPLPQAHSLARTVNGSTESTGLSASVEEIVSVAAASFASPAANR